ncbi:MAG: coproporphyrinogen III oxidase, partial [Paludibacteraceae bacterium]|nr:coproporphyrinogen III oxidase [Paludibacteraceae bacterium]
IDLIYGIHGQSIGQWRSDIQQAIRTGTQHISAYNLSYEEGTQLMRQLQSGEIVPPDDECCNRMYDLLCDELLKAGMEHYEISNFARPGYRSQHNSGYWTGRAYLGIGPSAHSYDGSSRQWNISSLTDYCNAIEQKRLPCEHETLTRTDHINERIMLGLRTAEGISMQTFLSDFGPEAWSRLTANAAKHIERRLLHADDTHIRATREGIRLLNIITSDLMFE